MSGVRLIDIDSHRQTRIDQEMCLKVGVQYRQEEDALQSVIARNIAVGLMNSERYAERFWNVVYMPVVV